MKDRDNHQLNIDYFYNKNHKYNGMMGPVMDVSVICYCGICGKKVKDATALMFNTGTFKADELPDSMNERETRNRYGRKQFS